MDIVFVFDISDSAERTTKNHLNESRYYCDFTLESPLNTTDISVEDCKGIGFLFYH